MVAPPTTVTLTGTAAAAGAPFNSATEAPPNGAGLFSVTVAVELTPLPVTLAGTIEREMTVSGFTVTVAVAEVVFNMAVIVGVTEEVTAPVVTVNVAVVAPANTVTLSGTAAAAPLVLDNVTTAPFVGAPPFSVTVPVELVTPPTTLVGFSETDVTADAAGFTLNVAVAEPFNVDEAVMTTLVFALTARLVTEKVAEVAFASTRTEPPTVAANGLPLDRDTEIPPDGAGPFRVTVPVIGALPPITVDGLRDTDRMDGGLTVSCAVAVPL